MLEVPNQNNFGRDANITQKQVIICLSQATTTTNLSGVVSFTTNLNNVIGFYVEYISVNPTPSFSASNANQDHFGTMLFLKSSTLSSMLNKNYNCMLCEGAPIDQYNLIAMPASDIIGVTSLSNVIPISTSGTNAQLKYDNTQWKRILYFGDPQDIQSFDFRVTGWPKTGTVTTSATGSLEISIIFFIKNSYQSQSFYSAQTSI